MIIELRNLIDKALSDAFVAGKSKMSFATFSKEWKKINLPKDKKLSKKVAKSNDDIHDLDEDEIF